MDEINEGVAVGRRESTRSDGFVTERSSDSPVTIPCGQPWWLIRRELRGDPLARSPGLRDKPVTKHRWTFATVVASMPSSVACGAEIHHHIMRTTIRFAAASLFAGALLAATAGAQTISIKGSDTLGAKLVPQLAEAFKSKNGGVKFEIAAEGSSTAFPALANGTAHIGMSSRKAKAEEITAAKAKGIDLKEVEVCQDMIVVIVNKNNPLKALTKDQVAKIFTGQVKDWSEVGGSPGPISIYTRNTSSGTYKDWQSLAMKGRDYPSNSQKMAGTEQIAQEVAKNKNGIGYVGLAYSKASGIHSVKIDGVDPVAANAKKFAYSRPCFLYVPATADATAKAFVDFATSAEGQKIAERIGFVPNK
jgi:phosphate transport system substrate-binding protein